MPQCSQDDERLECGQKGGGNCGHGASLAFRGNKASVGEGELSGAPQRLYTPSSQSVAFLALTRTSIVESGGPEGNWAELLPFNLSARKTLFKAETSGEIQRIAK